ncbi:hypothetical protein COO60DRAFT_1528849 [Scenedesmus sp. NREL 46B-D3]|nr:hypothetical protein COO60DRAFT_1528849 [Scenedesmus sp. NREL 46B-D3]
MGMLPMLMVVVFGLDRSAPVNSRARSLSLLATLVELLHGVVVVLLMWQLLASVVWDRACCEATSCALPALSDSSKHEWIPGASSALCRGGFSKLRLLTPSTVTLAKALGAHCLAAGAYAACTGFLLLLSVCGLALDEKFLDTVRPDTSGDMETRGNMVS